MHYSVHAYGVKYAEFNQEHDAFDWAKSQSERFNAGWWEVRIDGILRIAYQCGLVKWDEA